MFSGKNKKMGNILIILGLVVVAVVLYKYNSSKLNFRDSMQESLAQTLRFLLPRVHLRRASVDGSMSPESVVQATPTLQQKPFMAVSGMDTPNHRAPVTTSPLWTQGASSQDANSEWSKINPASGDLKNPTCLVATTME